MAVHTRVTCEPPPMACAGCWGYHKAPDGSLSCCICAGVGLAKWRQRGACGAVESCSTVSPCCCSESAYGDTSICIVCPTGGAALAYPKRYGSHGPSCGDIAIKHTCCCAPTGWTCETASGHSCCNEYYPTTLCALGPVCIFRGAPSCGAAPSCSAALCLGAVCGALSGNGQHCGATPFCAYRSGPDSCCAAQWLVGGGYWGKDKEGVAWWPGPCCYTRTNEKRADGTRKDKTQSAGFLGVLGWYMQKDDTSTTKVVCTPLGCVGDKEKGEDKARASFWHWGLGGIFTRNGKSCTSCCIPPACLAARGSCVACPERSCDVVVGTTELLCCCKGCFGKRGDAGVVCCAEPFEVAPGHTRVTCGVGGVAWNDADTTCYCMGCKVTREVEAMPVAVVAVVAPPALAGIGALPTAPPVATGDDPAPVYVPPTAANRSIGALPQPPHSDETIRGYETGETGAAKI